MLANTPYSQAFSMLRAGVKSRMLSRAPRIRIENFFQYSCRDTMSRWRLCGARSPPQSVALRANGPPALRSAAEERRNRNLASSGENRRRGIRLRALERDARKIHALGSRRRSLEKPQRGVPRHRTLEAEKRMRAATDDQPAAPREPRQDFDGVFLRSVAVQRSADEEDGHRGTDGQPKVIGQRRYTPRPANAVLGEVRRVGKRRPGTIAGDA